MNSEADRSENELNENIINTEETNIETQEENDSVPPPEEEPREKLVQLPIGRVKHIVKMDPEVNLVNQEAIFLITKSTVRFSFHCELILL